MTEGDCTPELAPAVVVRAALFPLRTLLRLADVELAALAATTGARSSAAFEQAYESSMQRQRGALSAATLEDPRFARALCLTNEDLSRRLGAKGGLPARRNKRARHLETTLYRYLARAVWRREPCDLWAGVALGTWGERSSVTPITPRYALSPDLGPYQFIVQTLARTPEYIERGVYKLNPTLYLDPHGDRWRYTVRVFTSVASRELPSRPGVDALIHALASMEPASLAGTAAELRRLGATDDALEALLTAFHSLGLLVGGLAFPRTFSSAWEALMAVAPELLPRHAAPWRSAVRRLRRICRRLERDMETLRLEESPRFARRSPPRSRGARGGPRHPRATAAPLRAALRRDAPFLDRPRP